MIPLTTTVRRLGAMAFGSSRPHAFDESELEFLQLVVAQVAVAVDNVLHEESARAVQAQLSQERDRLRLLLEVSESIAAHRNLNDLFRDLPSVSHVSCRSTTSTCSCTTPRDNVMRLHILVAPSDSTIRPGMELPVDGSAIGTGVEDAAAIDGRGSGCRDPFSAAHRRCCGRTACSRSAPFR